MFESSLGRGEADRLLEDRAAFARHPKPLPTRATAICRSRHFAISKMRSRFSSWWL
jgi:hypothetical protein